MYTLHQCSLLLLERSHHDDLTCTGEAIRDWFSKTDFAEIRPYANHTHGESAANRTAGSNFIEFVAEQSVGKPFYFQGSAADVRRDRDISREWYWAKDLSQPLAICSPPSTKGTERVCAMVDVDEYVDMPHQLAVHFMPHLLYTFVPSRAAADKGEYSYRFLADGSVEYIVSGGGTYVHHVWDYSHDSLKVTTVQWLWLDHGLVVPTPLWITAFYKVERRNVDEDHQVVLLSPMRRWTSLGPLGVAKLADSLIEGPKLTKLSPVSGEFVRLEIKKPCGMYVSTARVGDFSSSLVPSRVDDEAAIKASLTKDKLTVAMVKSSMENGGVADKFGAEVVTLYHRSMAKDTKARVFSNLDGVRSFQFLPKLADHEPEARPAMHSFMKPLVDGGFCPADTRGNEQRAVDKRVKAVRTQTRLTPFLKKAINAFVAKIATEVLVPVDEDEVRDRQARPTQRAILEQADLACNPGYARTFVKRQAETKVGDPRLITPIDGADKRDYSAFIYAAAELLKKLPWFISGRVPRDIAERVAAVAALAKWLLETDFSRMDGHISEVARYLEMTLMFALFAPSMHERLASLMKNQTMLECTTRHGVRYNTGLSRGSGSPETSAFNTILTGFVLFLAFLLSGFDQDEAWEELCMKANCCGDDAGCADLKANKAELAAAMVGQKLTVEVRARGEIFSFLSRFYGPEVWFGDPDSCCDLRRQLTKFHLAVYVENDHNARLIKLREKSFAFYLTDEHTPVLGTYVKKVLSLAPVQHGLGDGLEYRNLLRIWNSDVPKHDQYPSHVSGYGWKRELLEKQLPDLSVEKFEEWVAEATTLEALMNCPDPVVIPAVHPGGAEHVIVDDDVLPASQDHSRTRRGGRGRSATRRRTRGHTERRVRPETRGQRPRVRAPNS